ncbi:MAG: copper amine oxidase N-terminal domain-containing protein, partial [Clostridiales bacterium]|nr:copper amine oxidase N-terminal domain-containing protein [Clostridiales bacterium]
PLNFTLINPTIINDRVMVPIRETAEFLGMTVNWNPATGTMTCVTKTGDVITHTLYQNTISVNGKATAFDTPSQTISDRTVMPVRMLAEAIGAKVDFVEATSTVVIVKENATTPTPVKQLPSISSVISGTTNASAGNPVSFNVQANENTEKIQVINATTGQILATSGFGTTSGTAKIFTLSFTPTTNFQTMQLNFMPIGSDGVSGTPKLFTLAGTTPADNTGDSSLSGVGTAVIDDIEVDDDTIRLNDTVRVTVTTNNRTEKVTILDPNNNQLASAKTFTINGNARVFKLDIKPKKSGNVTFDVQATGGNGKVVTDDFKISISSSYSSSSSNGLIEDVELSEDNVDENETIDVTFTTNDTVERVWIELDGGIEEEESEPYDDDDSEYRWELELEVSESGYYRFYAEDEDGDEEYWVLPIVVEDDDDFQNDGYQIDNVETNHNSYDDGDTVEVTVRAREGAESVRITYDDKTISLSNTEFYYEDDVRVWILEFEADDNKSGKYTAETRGYNGDRNYYDFDIHID